MDTLSQPLLNLETDLQYLIIASLSAMELINSPPKLKTIIKMGQYLTSKLKRNLQ